MNILSILQLFACQLLLSAASNNPPSLPLIGGGMKSEHVTKYQAVSSNSRMKVLTPLVWACAGMKARDVYSVLPAKRTFCLLSVFLLDSALWKV